MNPDLDERAQATTSIATAIPDGDEGALRAVLDAVSSAWADGDASAFVEWYAKDATAILPGYYLQGKDGVRASMAAAFAGPLKASRRIHAIQSARFLGTDAAIVISKSNTAFPGEAEPAPERLALVTWVLSRRSGRWLVEAYHDCPAG
jgi:uncharacterized protein (TIGR02246 family)